MVVLRPVGGVSVPAAIDMNSGYRVVRRNKVEPQLPQNPYSVPSTGAVVADAHEGADIGLNHTMRLT